MMAGRPSTRSSPRRRMPRMCPHGTRASRTGWSVRCSDSSAHTVAGVSPACAFVRNGARGQPKRFPLFPVITRHFSSSCALDVPWPHHVSALAGLGVGEALIDEGVEHLAGGVAGNAVFLAQVLDGGQQGAGRVGAVLDAPAQYRGDLPPLGVG